NSRGLRGIFTPHFERSEIVAGPPAEPVNEIGSPACRQAGIFSNTYRRVRNFWKKFQRGCGV
ncbi:hypothetical protein COV89_00320, partial [Candidatus Shapirobacteria bacterium CG11_big_fil_rev_8_21_14_0_20_40_12]